MADDVVPAIIIKSDLSDKKSTTTIKLTVGKQVQLLSNRLSPDWEIFRVTNVWKIHKKNGQSIIFGILYLKKKPPSGH